MLVRRVAICSLKRSPSKLSRKWLSRTRQISSMASEAPAQQIPTAFVLDGITTQLDRLGPRIDVKADQIKIIDGPAEFYTLLKEKILKAKHRIFLSTLYVGKSEVELVSCIREALQHNKTLKVSILTDALRGTRETPEPSCASLLSPLVAQFPVQVEVRMYHTPNLTGLKKRIIPNRINEGWGLQHMKLYGVDDEVILTGANLSNDYFKNRQDRYHVFSSMRVSDYFARIHYTMCSASFLLRPLESTDSYTLSWPSENAAPSPLKDPQGYSSATTSLFTPFTIPSPPTPSRNLNTSIYPIITIPNSLNTELPIIQTLLTSYLPRGSRYLFTAGYFNPHPLISTSLLSCSAPSSPSSVPKSSVHGIVLTAHPHANGFFGSKGVSGMLPSAYTLLSRRFLRAVRKAAPGNIELCEWKRGVVGTPGGWTYHAKGLWLTLPQTSPLPSVGVEVSHGPSITIIGSSNYTIRSYSLDAEVGAVIVTSDEALMGKLKREEEALLAYSTTVQEADLRGEDRKVGLGVRVAMWIVSIVGGAL
ncbi:CDP-diacylglycerol--glycerol-3-phosphate 3-phosphatidyltransferase [Varicellaria rhodocarpa]|nr:CDP-diacylglycerol--glycerol-3-phosphate 3-phosphatidyltransferase [Varicellaria rhodocarpa]